VYSARENIAVPRISLGCAPPSALAIVLLTEKLRETRRVDAKWDLELCKRDVNLLTRHLDLWIRDFDLRTLEKRHKRSTESTYSRTDLSRLVETHEPNLRTDARDVLNLRQRTISMGRRPSFMGRDPDIWERDSDLWERDTRDLFTRGMTCRDTWDLVGLLRLWGLCRRLNKSLVSVRSLSEIR